MHDVERREPVWLALSTLFIDGDLDDKRICAIARTLRDSRYTHDELREIYQDEVAPVCYEHILHAGSRSSCYLGAQAFVGPHQPTGADPRWLCQTIVDHLNRPRSTPSWWPFGGLSRRMGTLMTRNEWHRVMQTLTRLRRDPWRLTETLQNANDVATLVTSLEDLGLLGPQAYPALKTIAELLNHRDFRVRAASVQAAANILGEQAIGASIALLADPSPTVKAGALAALHQSTDALVEPYPSGADGTVTPNATQHVLEQIARQALSSICAQLKDGKSPERVHAARLIERLGPSAAAAYKTLIDSFGDRNEAVRLAVADALVALNPPAQNTLTALKKAIFDESPRVRQTAALCLGKLLSRGDRRYYTALSALKAAVNDASPVVCESAITALGWMGQAAAEHIPHLARLAGAPRPATRCAALFALGQMQDAALEELPVMAAALKDPHPEVRRAALRAFAQLGPAVGPLRPQFEACLNDTDWLTQFEARRTLQAIRDDAPLSPSPTRQPYAHSPRPRLY